MEKIRFEWFEEIPDTMLIWYPIGYSWDDYHDAIQKILEQVGTDKLIHFINLHAKGAQFPKGSPTAHHRSALQQIKLGVIVYVTNDKQLMSSIRIFADILKRREGHEYAFVDKLETAKIKIKELIAAL